MTATVSGFVGKQSGLSDSLGARVAAWLRRQGFTAGPLAMRAAMDKRDAQRVLEGSCGPRAFDRLASAFGWRFLEEVMAPVAGGDHLTALEREIARERTEIAVREARLERLRSAHRARGAVGGGVLRLVGEEDRAFAPSRRRGDRDMGEE